MKSVLNTTESFMIETGKSDTDKRYHFFIQCNVGKARYAYGEYSYRDKNFHTDLGLKPELIAIVSDGKIRKRHRQHDIINQAATKTLSGGERQD